LILNANYQELTQLFADGTHQIVTFGQNPTCDVQGTQLRSNGPHGTLRIDHHTVEVPLPGRANLENVLAAWTICRECDVSMDEFCEAAKTLEPPERRMEIEQLGSVTLVNDCYNANIASMENALDCLQQLGTNEPKRRRVFICGQMAELGEQSEVLHKELGRLAAHHGVQLLLACGPWAQLVAATAEESQENGLQAHAFADTAQLCDNLDNFVQPDDIILVKGSRCAQLERVVEKLYEWFNAA
jgi:UDP-N-acetylmuramoyl-tripeptide--D-alanyl-D-alanine ligase